MTRRRSFGVGKHAYSIWITILTSHERLQMGRAARVHINFS